jgi:hypothetical protein
MREHIAMSFGLMQTSTAVQPVFISTDIHKRRALKLPVMLQSEHLNQFVSVVEILQAPTVLCVGYYANGDTDLSNDSQRIVAQISVIVLTLPVTCLS